MPTALSAPAHQQSPLAPPPCLDSSLFLPPHATTPAFLFLMSSSSGSGVFAGGPSNSGNNANASGSVHNHSHNHNNNNGCLPSTAAATASSPPQTSSLLGLAPLPSGHGDLLLADLQVNDLLVAFPDEDGDGLLPGGACDADPFALEDAGRLLMGGVDEYDGDAEERRAAMLVQRAASTGSVAVPQLNPNPSSSSGDPSSGYLAAADGAAGRLALPQADCGCSGGRPCVCPASQARQRSALGGNLTPRRSAVPQYPPGGMLEPCCHFFSRPAVGPDAVFNTLVDLMMMAGVDFEPNPDAFQLACLAYRSGARVSFHVQVFMAPPSGCPKADLARGPAYAVEVQRRCGDIVHFAEVYRCILGFMRMQGMVDEEISREGGLEQLCSGEESPEECRRRWRAFKKRYPGAKAPCASVAAAASADPLHQPHPQQQQQSGSTSEAASKPAVAAAGVSATGADQPLQQLAAAGGVPRGNCSEGDKGTADRLDEDAGQALDGNSGSADEDDDEGDDDDDNDEDSVLGLVPPPLPEGLSVAGSSLSSLDSAPGSVAGGSSPSSPTAAGSAPAPAASGINSWETLDCLVALARSDAVDMRCQALQALCELCADPGADPEMPRLVVQHGEALNMLVGALDCVNQDVHRPAITGIAGLLTSGVAEVAERLLAQGAICKLFKLSLSQVRQVAREAARALAEIAGRLDTQNLVAGVASFETRLRDLVVHCQADPRAESFSRTLAAITGFSGLLPCRGGAGAGTAGGDPANGQPLPSLELPAGGGSGDAGGDDDFQEKAAVLACLAGLGGGHGDVQEVGHGPIPLK